MLPLPNLMMFLDLRTILAVGGFVAYAAAAAMSIQAFKAQTFRTALWEATAGLASLATSSMLGFYVFSERSALLNWSSFCQTFIAAITCALVFASSDPLTPKLRRLAILLCLLVALGPMPHLYTSVVNYFDLALPLFDQASTYRFRIVLNVTVLVLGYSCMNALAQARDALRLRDSIDYDMLTGAHSRHRSFQASQ
jgi:hypothetical protein